MYIVYVYIYTYLIRNRKPGPGDLWTGSFSMEHPPPPETLDLSWAVSVADQKRLCSQRIHHKAVQRSLWNHALQQKDSDAGIESFWRYNFHEILHLLFSVGGSGESHGRPLRFPGLRRGVPGVPGDSRNSPGIPGILFMRIIPLYNSII